MSDRFYLHAADLPKFHEHTAARLKELCTGEEDITEWDREKD